MYIRLVEEWAFSNDEVARGKAVIESKGRMRETIHSGCGFKLPHCHNPSSRDLPRLTPKFSSNSAFHQALG
jgi:hypothetical protein